MHRQRREMAMVLPLVLLSICCVSAASPQADTPSVPNLNPDINTVLRDLSVQLAKLEVEVKHLQKQNEEQSTTLKQLELQRSELEDRLEQNKYEQLARQGQQHEIQQQQLVRMQQEDLKLLKTRQVAFSVSLQADGAAYAGPFDSDTHLIFRKVLQNIGNAYNSGTGIFTAPVKGAYHFEFHIYGHGESSHGLGAWLMKKDEYICSSFERQDSGASSSSNGATLLLEVGDVVSLRQRAGTKIYGDSTYRHNTFSGHLLFPM